MPLLLAICHTFFAFLSLMGFTGMFEYSIPLLGSIGVYHHLLWLLYVNGPFIHKYSM